MSHTSRIRPATTRHTTTTSTVIALSSSVRVLRDWTTTSSGPTGVAETGSIRRRCRDDPYVVKPGNSGTVASE
ncbi:MAG: hypothetical protein RDA78_13440 [Roseibium sp.]|uniref:hypothetical protein n=1 Tax=Roseibium sp. TaxID=1936156 RepID=UPI003D9C2251